MGDRRWASRVNALLIDPIALVENVSTNSGRQNYNCLTNNKTYYGRIGDRFRITH